MKTNNYKLEFNGDLKNGNKITTTFEVIFKESVDFNSEIYKSTIKEISKIITVSLVNY